jgi:hypothetical protein
MRQETGSVAAALSLDEAFKAANDIDSDDASKTGSIRGCLRNMYFNALCQLASSHVTGMNVQL